MGENTKIQWADHTFNPWEGCEKVSPGCAHCYAEDQNHRWGKDNWGKGKARRRTSVANWRKPLVWDVEAEACANLAMATDGPIGNEPRRQRVFCASMADWLDDGVPIEWLADLLNLIHKTPNLDWLLLTKRPELFLHRLHKAAHFGCMLAFRWHMLGEAPANIWIGTSVEDQQRANERIPALLAIPARVRFLSVEPMLEPIDIRHAVPCGYYCNDVHGHVDHSLLDLHWAIFGGESGPKARPCNVEWIRDGVRQCQAAGVAPFVKQLGSFAVTDEATPDGWPVGTELQTSSCVPYARVGLKHSKGGEPLEWPEDLRVRQFPEVR